MLIAVFITDMVILHKYVFIIIIIIITHLYTWVEKANARVVSYPMQCPS